MEQPDHRVELRCQAEAETQAIAAVVGAAEATVRHPTDPGIVDPAAAAVHAAGARSRPCGVGLRTVGVGSVPVLTPLPHVAAHVVQPQLVGLFTPPRGGFCLRCYRHTRPPCGCCCYRRICAHCSAHRPGRRTPTRPRWVAGTASR